MKWIVITRITDRLGKMPAARITMREATMQDFSLPKYEETTHCDVYRDFFDTEAEARSFIKENRQ
jgi:hypothetical protein